MAQTAGCFVQF